MSHGDSHPRQHFIPVIAGQRWQQLAYVEWGAPDNPEVVVCAHGLTRTGRDFDVLARALAARYRVVCPDAAGRGLSDRLSNPADYGYARYVADSAVLLARLGVDQVHWVGTSMGGILGMMLAAMPGTPLRSLVLNDVGDWIPKAALEAIAAYVGKAPDFDSLEQASAYVAGVSAGFGRLSAAQWIELTRHGARPDAAGRWHLSYDPAIAQAFAGPLGDVDLRAFWQAVRIPGLILRGADSGLLTAEVLLAMQQVRPDVAAHTFAGCGHAPALQEDEQIAAIRTFLDSQPTAPAGQPSP